MPSRPPEPHRQGRPSSTEPLPPRRGNADPNLATTQAPATRPEEKTVLPTASICCPYCGENFDILVDPSVPSQEYVEDCAVCCQPVLLRVELDLEGEIRSVSANVENG